MVTKVRGNVTRHVSQLNVAMLPKYQRVSGVVHSWAANETDSEPMILRRSLLRTFMFFMTGMPSTRIPVIAAHDNWNPQSNAVPGFNTGRQFRAD